MSRTTKHKVVSGLKELYSKSGRSKQFKKKSKKKIRQANKNLDIDPNTKKGSEFEILVLW